MPEYSSFESIIKMEYEKYLNTDGVQKLKLDLIIHSLVQG
jgi:hypothetical protein